MRYSFCGLGIMILCLPEVFPVAAGGVKPAQVAAACSAVFRHTDAGHAIFHAPCWGRLCAPQAERAAILKVTPHSGSDSAAVRNHD